MTIPFEQEYPEEGIMLAELCNERAEQKAQGICLQPLFLDELTGVDKVGRNDPCPCGSGKKYKKCCIMN